MATRNQVENSQHLTTVVHNEHAGLQRELRNMKSMFQEKNKKVDHMEASFFPKCSLGVLVEISNQVFVFIHLSTSLVSLFLGGSKSHQE